MKATTANKSIFRFLQGRLPGHFLVDEPLSRHTWYRIGGPADFLVYPRDEDSLIELCVLCKRLNIDTYLMGKGANLLVSDRGFEGVVLNLERSFRWICREGESLKVGAGLALEELILWCEKNHLGGLEGLSGIPATLGGALSMNAGAGGIEIGNVVNEVRLLDEQLQPRSVDAAQIGFDYRAAPGLQKTIILECSINLYSEREEKLRNARLVRITERASKQPLEFPSCGSVFKRPKKGYAGRFIEKAGMKGLKHGNAMISDKHAGFIVNLGGATAEEIFFLIKQIQEKIFEKFDVELELEVKLIGF